MRKQPLSLAASSTAAAGPPPQHLAINGGQSIMTTMQQHLGYFWRFTFTLAIRGAAGVV
jgi:hypothetical protein